jgi:CubicO group peptidase (beta-lactamase class C family)
MKTLLLRSAWLTIALLFILPVALYAQQKPDKTDEYIETQMRRQKIPGLSIAVVKDGKIIKARGYGLANIETNTPATEKTVYKIASVSKQFIAAGIMLLVDEGKINLDDNVTKYITEAPETWKDITIRHLLSHTSGLVRDIPNFDGLKVISDTESIKSAFPAPFRFAPGTKWAYCNVGYYTLAEIIKRVSGKPWPDFFYERIFKPAGMTQTQTTNIYDIIPDRASGYSQSRQGLENAPVWLALRPSGGFISSVLDMAKWDAALYSDSVLKTASKEQMWAPVKLSDGTFAKYGLGWFIDSQNGHRRIHHDGGVPGFSSNFERYVDDKFTVIVLANTDGANLINISEAIAGLYISELTPVTEKVLADTEPEITAKVRSLIDGFIKGDLDLKLLAPDIAAEINDKMKKTLGEELSSSGKINSMTLIEKTVKDDKRTYRYRLDYKNDSFFFICTFNKDNKIVGFGTRD